MAGVGVMGGTAAMGSGAGMKKEHVSENSIMIYDDVMYPDNVTYEHIGEISIS